MPDQDSVPFIHLILRTPLDTPWFTRKHATIIQIAKNVQSIEI